MPKRNKPLPYQNAVNPPLFCNASYYFESREEVINGLHEKTVLAGRYGRYDNPTWIDVETKIAQLCKAESALVFSSGMAAIVTSLLSFLKSGDHVVFPAESYRQSRNVFSKILPDIGVVSHEHSIKDSDAFIAFLGDLEISPRIVHLEIPSSPHMYLTDLERVREVVGKDVIIFVDCSFAPPPNFFPLTWGADIAVYSATKYLSGHGDIMCGCVTGKSTLLQTISWYRDTMGGITDGFSSWLLARSLHTLPLRIKDVNEKAKLLASYLSNHSLIDSVFYTDLRSHPHFDLAEKYLHGGGGVVTFQLNRSQSDTAVFVDMLTIPYMASNFGAPQTLIEQSTLFTYFEYSEEELKSIGVTHGTVRIALGYTDSIEEVIADIDSALSSLTKAGTTSAIPERHPPFDV